MGTQAPRTLLQLAAQGLLTKEAVAISALADLPMELFPPLFTEALASRSAEALRAMVQAWPFPCLPLGALMKTPHLDTLQAVLEGLDGLLSLQVRPRRWRLQVLDLRNVHENFWNVWSGAMTGARSPRALSDNQAVEDRPGSGAKQPLKVVIDLCLHDLDQYQTYLFKWLQQRKSVLQACCKKMQIWALPIYSIIEVLKIFQPEHIQELELNIWWDLSSLAWFAPSLGQMRNLRKLFVKGIKKTYYSESPEISPEQEEVFVTFIISQFPKLKCLQQLSLSGVYFLEGNLDRVLRCLETPLESLSITYCDLSESDMKSLMCPAILQLKHLNLSGVIFRFSPEPLRFLLERVAATLETLELEFCRFKDAQLRTLLPALSQCSRLTVFKFYDNDISMSALKDLLGHTGRLNHLILELYPAPLESYDEMDAVLPEILAPRCAELMDTLRAIRQPKMALFATKHCFQCQQRCVYDLEISLCPCMSEI